jgi:maltooligosyltrehalose trehalohydrolase
MDLLPLDQLGAREIAPGQMQFGVFLPWVSAADGNRLIVKIIHESDQFLQEIPPLEFSLQHAANATYGDYWSARIAIRANDRPHPQSAWGTPGTYVYRFQLHSPTVSQPIDWIIDPYAREFGVGKLSAFTLGYQPYAWSAQEAGWTTPPLHQLIIYELMLNEFGGGLDGAIAHLPYLADLGINCIEVMPVSDVGLVVDWGFLPIGYFGVDERFGNRKDFQRFVDVAHQHGIAVVVDSVYGHTSEYFPYQYLYTRLQYHENPFMGPFAKDYFGCSTDYNRKLTQDFFYSVNNHWLETYHIDGFRYDCVPNYWDGPAGNGYSNLTWNTHQLVKSHAGDTYWQRFFNGAGMNLVQCAEQLEDPVGVLWQSYSNCTWQNATLGAANSAAQGNRGSLTDLGLRLGLEGYPAEVTVNGETLRKSALQYLENHDHSRFVCNFGVLWRDWNYLFNEGDRGLWYKLQPYLIALLAARGIPMLWQGQEFGSNSVVPDSGLGRVMLFRPVRWDYFYDEVGRSLVALVRTLLRMRRNGAQFQTGGHFFYNDWDSYQSKGLLLFSRADEQHFSLVALNFTDQDQSVPFRFARGGSYYEELHGIDNLGSVAAGEERRLQIPSNYGRIWTA